jgi:phosphoenolpyruvate phosphomutase
VAVVLLDRARKRKSMNGAVRLRALLDSGRIVRLVGAHDPLGGRVAARAGFDGVWASSLEACTSRGLPDTGVITMRECLASAVALVESVPSPVVADCDTGFGDATAVAKMVRRFEAGGIAGVSIEDQCSQKINSLAAGRHVLVSVEAFTSKLRAAKTAQRRPDFVVIARTEALIAGLGVREALHRAEAYADAGADAILVHNKMTTAGPIADFLAAWSRRVPIVVVPTTYPDCTAAELERMGARMVIYANHGMRAAIRAMERSFAAILRDGCTRGVEDAIATVQDVFDLQAADRGVSSVGDRCA